MLCFCTIVNVFFAYPCGGFTINTIYIKPDMFKVTIVCFMSVHFTVKALKRITLRVVYDQTQMTLNNFEGIQI